MHEKATGTQPPLHVHECMGQAVMGVASSAAACSKHRGARWGHAQVSKCSELRQPSRQGSSQLVATEPPARGPYHPAAHHTQQEEDTLSVSTRDNAPNPPPITIISLTALAIPQPVGVCLPLPTTTTHTPLDVHRVPRASESYWHTDNI